VKENVVVQLAEMVDLCWVPSEEVAEMLALCLISRLEDDVALQP
jgi:hypothetical protein